MMIMFPGKSIIPLMLFIKSNDQRENEHKWEPHINNNTNDNNNNNNNDDNTEATQHHPTSESL